MWTSFREGQIIPKRLRLAEVELQRARHRFLFGSTCLVYRRRVVNLQDGRHGAGFLIKRTRTAKRGDGTRQNSGCMFRNITMLGIPPHTADAYMPYAEWWLGQQ